jgi:hypothetical protein
LQKEKAEAASAAKRGVTPASILEKEHDVENPILEKVRSGASAQTFALPTKKKVSKQME